MSANQTAGFATRRRAADRLAEVLAGAPFEPFTADDFADQRDRAFVNRLVTRALRRHGHLNLVIADLLARGLPKRSPLFEPVLRIALTELLFDDAGADHAAVNLAVDILKADPRARHHAGLLNGVLRQAQRRRGDFADLPPAALFPQWLREEWQTTYGADALTEFAAALLADPALDLTLKPDAKDYAAKLGAEALLPDSLRLTSRQLPVRQLPGFAEGDWWVQDIAASLPARLMGISPVARVLDLCAAPGGKTAQLASAGYTTTALDQNPQRIERLKANMARLHLTADIICADAMSYAPSTPFDAILLDAPCTATGTFRRHPETIWHRTKADVADRAVLQRKLILAAMGMLKKGGTLIFATCALQRAEGEAHAETIAAGQIAGLASDPIAPAEVPGFESAVTPQGWMRTGPGLETGAVKDRQMDGFFIARFKTY